MDFPFHQVKFEADVFGIIKNHKMTGSKKLALSIFVSAGLTECVETSTRHVFVKHGCPRRQQSQNMAKISKSYILTPPHPQGHVMSVKCEEPIVEPIVQVWLLYHHPNCKYCTFFVSETELQTNRRTDGRTDKRTDGLTIRLLDAPGGPFRPGHKNGVTTNTICFVLIWMHDLCSFTGRFDGED